MPPSGPSGQQRRKPTVGKRCRTVLTAQRPVPSVNSMVIEFLRSDTLLLPVLLSESSLVVIFAALCAISILVALPAGALRFDLSLHLCDGRRDVHVSLRDESYKS